MEFKKRVAKGSMQRSFAGSRRFRYAVIRQLPQKLSKNHSVLREQRKELKKLKSFISGINKASQEEVLALMDANRVLEKSSAASNELIKNKNITGKNRMERLILENNLLLSECASILASKLYMPKPVDISSEDWKKHGEEMRAWAGDDWDDPSYDVYDADFAPILAK